MPPEHGMDVCKQALYNHFSRLADPAWWRSVDWFEAHKQEFKRGECVVIRDALVVHRTYDEKEHMAWLLQNPSTDNLRHVMDDDGQERVYRL